VPSHAQIERQGPNGEKKIRCVLAHDHVLLRQGLRRLLEDEPDIEVVAEAGNAAETSAAVGAHTPDVVVTDTATLGCDADRAEQMILTSSPQSRVLFLATREDEEEHPDQSRRAKRRTSVQELVEFLRKYCSTDRAVVREMPKGGGEDGAPEKSRKQELTAREHEVLELLAAGRTVRAVAKVLGLSVKTVDAHKFNLMRKLRIHNKAELVMWAIEKRIVKLSANF
jgi:DNA-binding NarL/FixJ family response regulator